MAATKTKAPARRKSASRRELIDTGTNELFVRRNERGTSLEGGRCRPLDHGGQAPQGQAQGAIWAGGPRRSSMTRGLEKPANPAQEKSRIDRGKEGDKTPGFDPGVAPLGTDEEAAGNHAIVDGMAAIRRHPEEPTGQTADPDETIAPDGGALKPTP